MIKGRLFMDINAVIDITFFGLKNNAFNFIPSLYISRYFF